MNSLNDSLSMTLLEIISHVLNKHKNYAPMIEAMAAQTQGKQPAAFIDSQRKYYGLNELDSKLEKYLNFDNGYFVELGANDGITQSNTLHFEIYKNWRGVLVEPTPHNYLQCLRNRSNENSIHCNACVSFGYSEKFVEIAFSNLMSTPIGLESDISDPKQNALIGKQYLSSTDQVFSFGSLARTLNSILQDAQAPKLIDLLSLDVEGAEIDILKGVDHQEFAFKYMCIECRDIEKTNNYCNSIGYTLIEKLTHHDYLFEKLKG